MRKILYVSVALAATLGGALLIAAPAQAAATAVLFTTTGGGTNVPVNATLNAALKTGTTANFTAGSGTVKCSASTFTAKVVTNPAAGGTATESLTGQTFSSCTATGIAGVTGVQSVTVNGLPYNASVNGTTKAVALTGRSRPSSSCPPSSARSTAPTPPTVERSTEPRRTPTTRSTSPTRA